jgi:hypothetical protein
LIKIDAKGFEMNVFKGASKFLELHGFSPNIFEACTIASYVEEKRALFDFVTSLGYEITSFHVQDFVAQHPAHTVHVDIRVVEGGAINLQRTR